MGIKGDATLQVIVPDPSVHLTRAAEIIDWQMPDLPFGDCQNFHPDPSFNSNQPNPVIHFRQNGPDICYLGDFDITLIDTHQSCIFLPARRCCR